MVCKLLDETEQKSAQRKQQALFGALPIGLKPTPDPPSGLPCFPTAHSPALAAPLAACGASKALHPLTLHRPLPHTFPPLLLRKYRPPALVFREEPRHGWAHNLGAHRPGVPHGRCLPRYRKPLCLHCVGAVIFEASGDTLRSLLSEISCLARITLHEPLAAVRPSPRHGSVISAHLAASCLGLRQQSMMAAEKGGRDSTQEGEGLGPDTCWGLGQVEGASSRRSYWCPLHPWNPDLRKLPETIHVYLPRPSPQSLPYQSLNIEVNGASLTWGPEVHRWINIDRTGDKSLFS